MVHEAGPIVHYPLLVEECLWTDAMIERNDKLQYKTKQPLI